MSWMAAVRGQVLLLLLFIIIIALQFRWGREMDYIELKVRE